MKLRIDKICSDYNLASRKEIRDYVKKGRIRVDGEVLKSSSDKVDPLTSIITVDGVKLEYEEYSYFMLNKPDGVLSAAFDKKQRTVLNLLSKPHRSDLFPVGRLDKDTTGLLLISNDGPLSHELLSPKKHVDKVYEARVKGRIRPELKEVFARGFQYDEDLVSDSATLEILSYDEIQDQTLVHVTIHEGKFHQIKKMFLAVGSEVLSLKRVSFGPLKLDESLKEGEYRRLTQEEINLLKEGHENA